MKNFTLLKHISFFFLLAFLSFPLKSFCGLLEAKNLPDTTHPIISSYYPTQGAEDVVSTPILQMVFNEAVYFLSKDKGVNFFRIYRKSDDALIFDFGPSNFVVMNDTIQLGGPDKKSGLAPGTEYYINIDSDYIYDGSGNTFRGIYNNTTWSFTTAPEDTLPPVVETYFPAQDAENVPLLIDFVLKFNEPIEWAVIKKEYLPFRLYRYSDDNLEWAWNGVDGVTLSNDTLRLWFTDPTKQSKILTPLAYDEKYYLMIDSNIIADASEGWNLYKGIYDKDTWAFTTAPVDTIDPQVVCYVPETGDTGVSTMPDIRIIFNEPIQFLPDKISTFMHITVAGESVPLVSFPISYFDIIHDTVLIFNGGPSKPSGLPYNTEFFVTLDSNYVYDLQNNSYKGIYDDHTWTFKTAPLDTFPPQVTNYNPEPAETGVSVNPILIDLSMTFNESIKKYIPVPLASKASPYTPFLHLLRKSDDSLFITVPLQAFEIIDDTILHVSPPVKHKVPALPYSTEFYINIDSNWIQDESDNFYKGIYDNSTWTFTTMDEDTICPYVTYKNPLVGATGVSIDADLHLVFSEPVEKNIITKKGTVADRLIIKKFSDDVTVVDLSISDADIIIENDTVLTLQNPGSALPYNTHLYVLIDSNAVKDYAGNFYAGIYNKAVWHFTTELNIGMPENKLNTMDVYPNPSNGNIIVNAPINSEITIYSALGKLVYNKHTTQMASQYDLSNLNKGIYIVQIKNTSFTEPKTIKLVIK